MEGQVQWDGFERQLLRRPRLEGRAVEWKVLEERGGAAARLWCGCSQRAGVDICSSQGRRSEFWDLWEISQVPCGGGESGLTVVMHPSRAWGWSPSGQGHCSELWAQGPGELAEEGAGRGLGLNSQQRPGRSAGSGPSGGRGRRYEAVQTAGVSSLGLLILVTSSQEARQPLGSIRLPEHF